ncbi:MAG: 2,3-bisphosphoglycerate-independent phosphoglycerate mutase [Planctomycetota bacterium]|jgi:2,3-bisphosphoglycerate-independent phosphoglycerate mutase
MDRPRNAPLVLIVRDGWGENPHPDHDRFNAVKLASTPVADRLMREYPTTLIRTCGEDVGLPAGVMGNSEVGHQNIGAGRVVDQEVMRITRAVRDRSFFENPALIGAFDHAQKTGGLVHLLGLVSDGQVHSDLDHLLALIDLAAQREFPADRLLVHAITDGRDTAPKGGLGYVERVLAKLSDAGVGRIGSVMGRYYAMDRDNRWDRVALAWNCLTGRGDAPPAPSALDAIRDYYDHPTEPSRTGDEFIVPARIGDDLVEDGDAIIFFNFRGDRPRELTRAFMLDDRAWAGVANGGFDRGPKLEDLYYCTMSRYEEGLPVTAVAFQKPPKMANMLGDVIARAGLTQFRCAETEKYPHVTFFFNDYREEPFDGESRLLVPSPKEVSTYDQKPEMSAYGVCDGVVDRLGADDGETLIVVNFANGDMVGHTGNLEAATRAVEVADECVGRIVEATLQRGGTLIVTADHGNAEQMWDPKHDCPHTAHTTYDVVLTIVGAAVKGQALRAGGRLADIAPTILAMLDLEPPPEMTGTSLLQSQPAAAPRP